MHSWGCCSTPSTLHRRSPAAAVPPAEHPHSPATQCHTLPPAPPHGTIHTAEAPLLAATDGGAAEGGSTEGGSIPPADAPHRPPPPQRTRGWITHTHTHTHTHTKTRIHHSATTPRGIARVSSRPPSCTTPPSSSHAPHSHILQACTTHRHKRVRGITQ